MKISFLLMVIVLMTSCAANRSGHFCTEKVQTASENRIEPEYVSSLDESQDRSRIQGKVYDQFGEGVPFARVILYVNDSLITGALTDLDGSFRISHISPGVYSLKIESMGYGSIWVRDIKINDKDIILFIEEIVLEDEVLELKPIIYFYPKEKIDLHVELDYEGKLTTTYPRYNSGWEITAYPDGTLRDSNGKSYYALYWEGKPDVPLTIPNGKVVRKNETIKFLEESLELLGLSERESNEFIIFWLPILNKSPYNLIHFASDQYEAHAQLNITPEPETMIRVMMVFQSLDKPINIVLQDLSTLAKQRKGFTVIEWGGQEVPKIRPI